MLAPEDRQDLIADHLEAKGSLSAEPLDEEIADWREDEALITALDHVLNLLDSRPSYVVRRFALELNGYALALLEHRGEGIDAGPQTRVEMRDSVASRKARHSGDE